MPRNAWLAIALALCGCQSAPQLQRSAPAPQRNESADDHDSAAALLLANTFQIMQRLAQAAPAEQAELLTATREAYERTPQGSAQLRYALLLAIPGHLARDPAKAQALLRELAAQPETLEPIERAVALVELAQLDQELDLKSDNDRLQAAARRADRERISTSQRRLQAESDENAKLRKQLDDAQAKLDAIAKLERNMTDRKNGAEERQQ